MTTFQGYSLSVSCCVTASVAVELVQECVLHCAVARLLLYLSDSCLHSIWTLKLPAETITAVYGGANLDCIRCTLR